MEGTREALEIIAATVAAHGTTSLVATTVTASEKETRDSVAGIARLYPEYQPISRRASSPRKFWEFILRGPLSVRRAAECTRRMDRTALSASSSRRLLKEARGTAQILTLAPELPGALELIAAARKAGLVVSLGHTDATYEQAQAAIEAGATHAAHVFNAMRPFSHRGTGVLGAVLTSPEVSAELIADGVHVDEAAMRMLVDLKTPERVILVSDGISATGMPDGKYQLGMFEVKVSGASPAMRRASLPEARSRWTARCGISSPWAFRLRRRCGW